MRTSVEEEIDEHLSQNFVRVIKYTSWVLLAYFILALIGAAWLLFTSIRLKLISAEGEAATEKLLRLNLVSSFFELLVTCTVLLVIYFVLSIIIARVGSQVFFKIVYPPRSGLQYLRFSETYSANIYRGILWLTLPTGLLGAAIALHSSQSDQNPVLGFRWVLLGFVGGSIGIFWFEKLRAIRFPSIPVDPTQSLAIESISISEGLNSSLVIVLSLWVIASIIAPGAGNYLNRRIIQRDRDYSQLVQEVIDEPGQQDALIRRYRLALADLRGVAELMITGVKADWDTAGVIKAGNLNVRNGPGLVNEVSYQISSEYLTQVLIDLDSVKPVRWTPMVSDSRFHRWRGMGRW